MPLIIDLTGGGYVLPLSVRGEDHCPNPDATPDLPPGQAGRNRPLSSQVKNSNSYCLDQHSAVAQAGIRLRRMIQLLVWSAPSRLPKCQ